MTKTADDADDEMTPQGETSSLLRPALPAEPLPSSSPGTSKSKFRSIDSFIDAAAVASSAVVAVVAPSSASGNSNNNGDMHRTRRCRRRRRRRCCCFLPLPPRYILTIASIGLANASFSTSILLISYLLADAPFNASIMHDDPTKWGGLLAAAVFGGMLPGGLISGITCDSPLSGGRRPVLLLALFANLVTGVWTAFVNDPITLIVVRFMAGLAIGATEPPLFALVTEISPRKHRGLCVAFVASFWMVGNLVVATVGLVVFRYLNWSWRSYVLLCSVPAACGLIMVAAFVPESPRFLASVGGRYDEAVGAANDIARSLGMQLDADTCSSSSGKKNADVKAGPLRSEEVMRQYPPRARNASAAAATAERQEDAGKRHSNEYGGNSDEHNSSSCLSIICGALSTMARNATQLYTDPHLRTNTTLPLQIVWFALCYGSYCLVTWINTIYVAVELDDMYMNLLIFALANLPGNIVSFFLIDSRTGGRINTLIGSLALSALSLVAFAYYARPASVSYSHVSTAGIVGSSCAFQALETVAWNVIDVATGELFPTSVRSTGIGVCTATGRLGAMAAQFASGALADRPVLILLVASTSLAVAAIVPFTMRRGEMSRLPLSDEVGDSSRRQEERVQGAGGGECNGQGATFGEQR